MKRNTINTLNLNDPCEHCGSTKNDERRLIENIQSVLFGSSIDDSESEIKESTESDFNKRFNPFSRLSVFLLILITAGLTGIVLSGNLPDEFKHVLRDVSVTISSISIISLIYEHGLRQQFISQMQKTVKEVLKLEINKHFASEMNAGIEGFYEQLDISEVKNEIKKLKNDTIYICKIFMRELDELVPVILDAIVNRGNNVEMVILNSLSTEALDKRRKEVGYLSLDSYINNIQMNIELARSIYRRLPPCKKDKFKLKLHNSFVGISLLGIGDSFYVGFYLNGRSATSGSTLLIKGEKSFFYKDLFKHFNETWKKAETYDFSKETLEIPLAK